MKSARWLWGVVAGAGVLIAVICITAAMLVSGQLTSDKYYEHMRSARQYLTAGDYEKVIEAYKAAIDLKPEDPEAYIALAQVYMDNEQYEEARALAQLGYGATRDLRLEALIRQIGEDQWSAGDEASNKITMEQDFVADGTDAANLELRYAALDDLSDFCYQEFVDTYGQSTATYISEMDGYQMKFQGLNARVYYKNTEEYPFLIDTATRIPAANARPYKLELLSPSLIFVGFDGYVSYTRLCEMFKSSPAPVYDAAAGQWHLTFEKNGASLVMTTDSAGNIYEKDTGIVIYPGELIKTEWEEVIEETQTQEEEKTFTLGSQTYRYDVESIYINNEQIGSLKPLAACKNLRELIFIDCVVDSLEPLSECSALSVLYLRGTTGFWDLSPLENLSELTQLDLHGCADVFDISPIMTMNLMLLHTCETGVSYEQTLEYKQRHPECDVWYDNSPI